MKSWIKSRTNRFGGLLVTLGIAIASLPELRDVVNQLSPEYQGYAVLLIGIIVMILRHITTGPVSTNVKAVGSTVMMDAVLNHAGFLEAVLIQNNVSLREIKSDMEIDESWLRDIYTVWNVMEQAREMKGG